MHTYAMPKTSENCSILETALILKSIPQPTHRSLLLEIDVAMGNQLTNLKFLI